MMRTSISARHFKVSDRLKEYAQEEVQRLTRYFDGIVDCNIELSYQKQNKTSEVALTVHGNLLKASETSDDFRKSIALSVDKLERQLKKYKGKLREKAR
ncbi:MAG: ribosome-associated translation inhibitor RaiA [Calditrichaeota bacterium]|nr:ribosome-associated translation inhibitor RaiA [Calditrichota bacterium]